MKYRLAYIELTNFCGLACDFCPPENRQKTKMPLELFAKLAPQLNNIAKRIALHLKGDPLAVDNLEEYLNIALANDLKIELTTSGYYLTQDKFKLLTSKPIVQINFSIQSILANQKLRNVKNELSNIINFCKRALALEDYPFINLRLWALNDDETIKVLRNEFNAPFGERLAPKIRLKTAPIFEWPDVNSGVVYIDSYCHAPFDQFGVLSNGKVVPCCLDKDAIVELGDINYSTLKDILSYKKIQDIKIGFLKNKTVEELCKHCSYRLKFEK